jgi:starch synthase
VRVVHLSAECAPFAKAGGLADVVGALPKYLGQHGVEAAVLMPDYGRHSSRPLPIPGPPPALVYRGVYRLGDRVFVYAVRRTDAPGFPLLLLDAPAHFGPAGIYVGVDGPHPNEPDRWLAFQVAAVDYLAARARAGDRPDVLHAHDHHTGLFPALVKRSEAGARLRGVPVAFTVHSAEHQGVYGAWTWPWLGLPGQAPVETRDPDDRLNSLRAAALDADRVTTVSPTYAEELQRDPAVARGLADAFRAARHKFVGVVNGIDPDVWSPAVDPFLPARYDRDDLTGKAACKAAVCAEFGLDPARPLVVYVGRLMEEKGAEILPEILARTLAERDASAVVLGTGDGRVEDALRGVADGAGGRLALRFGFDEGLAHRLYAGADVLLMPSKVEPCGLAQLYALAYGTPPVVHATGGLRDTVTEWDGQAGNGFRFEAYTAEAGTAALARALDAHADPGAWRRLQRSGMAEDHSWARSAAAYADLYRAMRDER